MSERVTRELIHKSGDLSLITYVCWEEGEKRGFYIKGSPSDPDAKKCQHNKGLADFCEPCGRVHGRG